jgi:hypothetical protein
LDGELGRPGKDLASGKKGCDGIVRYYVCDKLNMLDVIDCGIDTYGGGVASFNMEILDEDDDIIEVSIFISIFYYVS